MKIKKIITFGIGSIFSSALSVITLPLLAWVTTPKTFSDNAVFLTLTGLCTSFLCLGLDQAYMRQYHEHNSKKNIYIYIKPTIISFSLLLILILLLKNKINNATNENGYFLILVISFIFFLTYIQRFISTSLRMQEKTILFSLSIILQKTIYIAILLFAYISSTRLDFLGIQNYLLYSLFISTLILFIFDRRNISLTDKRQINKTEIQFGIPLMLSALIFWGLSSSSLLILKLISSPISTSLYSLSVSFAGLGLVVQSIFTTIWIPIVYKWDINKTFSKKTNIVAQFLILTYATLIALIPLLAPLIVLILPESYNEIASLLTATLIPPFLYTLSEVTGIGINIKRAPRYNLIAISISLFFGIIINYILIFFIDIKGAVLANCISYYIYFYLRTRYSNKLLNSPPSSSVYLTTLLLILYALTPILVDRNYFIYFQIFSLILLIFILALFLTKSQKIIQFYKNEKNNNYI